jgi:hypothetical protein
MAVHFLLGAGFGYDARSAALEIEPDVAGRCPECAYPLVSDLWDICFPGEELDREDGFEAVFAERLAEGERKPLRKLIETVSKADWYLGGAIFPAESNPVSCYLKLLETFDTSSFLTFNYDILLELGLINLERWTPRDGFGVSVKVNPDDYYKDTVKASSNLVVHLHGTLAVYVGQDGSFKFDAGWNANQFRKHERIWPDLMDDDFLESRIIAPVPSKLKEVTAQRFVRSSYDKALQLLGEQCTLVSIGYSFATTDSPSYRGLLNKLVENNSRLVIVAPDANEIAKRLGEYELEVRVVTCGFKRWAENGFPETN